MKLTDAFWEKRNLGVSAIEITIEEGDPLETVESGLRGLRSDYLVVKAPTCRLDLYFLLQKLGFAFAETSIRVSHELDRVIVPPLIDRLCSNMSFEEMQDYDLLEDNIRKGFFQTDRVVLDPYFTAEQAAERYIGWMKDERIRGAHLFHYLYKGNRIGFSCMRLEENGECYPVLGGIYPSDRPLPLGSAILYKQLEIARALGGKHLYTNISSNNLAVAKAYNQCGYSLDEISYVFVKHMG